MFDRWASFFSPSSLFVMISPRKAIAAKTGKSRIFDLNFIFPSIGSYSVTVTTFDVPTLAFEET